MKKFMIAAAIVAISAATALSVGKTSSTPVVKVIKIEKTDFPVNGLSKAKGDLGSAD